MDLSFVSSPTGPGLRHVPPGRGDGADGGGGGRRRLGRRRRAPEVHRALHGAAAAAAGGHRQELQAGDGREDDGHADALVARRTRRRKSRYC